MSLINQMLRDLQQHYARLLSSRGDYDALTKVMLNGGLPAVEEDPEPMSSWPLFTSALEGQRLQPEAVECYQRDLKTETLRKDLLAYAQKRLRALN